MFNNAHKTVLISRNNWKGLLSEIDTIIDKVSSRKVGYNDRVVIVSKYMDSETIVKILAKYYDDTYECNYVVGSKLRMKIKSNAITPLIIGKEKQITPKELNHVLGEHNVRALIVDDYDVMKTQGGIISNMHKRSIEAIHIAMKEVTTI